jgi:hypothetical protein
MKVVVLVMVKIFDVNEETCMVRDHMWWHQFGSHYLLLGRCAINVAVWPSGSIC